MKKLAAAITMVRDGGFFLEKWVSWYGTRLGKENLFILFDGQDQVPPACTQGCNTLVLPRVEGNVAQGDRGRAAVISSKAAQLLEQYRFVIGTDADEYVIPDPSTGLDLAEFLTSLEPGKRVCLSPLGLDVVQNTACEKELDKSVPVLKQRTHAFLSTRYTKASILCAPAQWGSGFHRVRGSDFTIVENLYLFHFGCADAAMVLDRVKDSDLSSRGWDRHLAKRRRLFDTVCRLKVRDFDAWVPRARRMQSRLRPPYAWNKPSMLGIRILVRIPDRFRNLI